MAVKLRLKRIGAKKNPFYRIVAMDERKPRESNYLECLGTYDPRSAENTKVDSALALKLLANGAQPTDTVRSVLRKAGVMKAYHESKAKKAPGVKKEAAAKPAAKAAKPAAAKAPAAKKTTAAKKK